MLRDQKFPRYYEVDDLIVKMDRDPETGDIVAFNQLGSPYPPVKAMFEGRPISESKWLSLKQALV